MKKIVLLSLCIITFFNVFALDRIRFKIINFQNIAPYEIPHEDSMNSLYNLESNFVDNSEDVDPEFEDYYDSGILNSSLCWKLNFEIVSLFSQKDLNGFYDFFTDSCYFLNKSNLWVLPYRKYDGPTMGSNSLEQGVLFFSESGVFKKKLVTSSCHIVLSKSIRYANRNLNETSYTNSSYFYCFPYIISAFGDIMGNVNEYEDNIQYFGFTENEKTYYYTIYGKNNNFFYFDVNTNIKILQYIHMISNIIFSSDFSRALKYDQNQGFTDLFEINLNTKLVEKKNSFNLKRISGLSYTTHVINGVSYFNYYAGFFQDTNILEFIVDDTNKYLIEIFYE